MCKGQCEAEGAALSWLATGPDTPSLGIHQALGDGETQSRADAPRTAARASGICSPETVKDVGQVLWLDTFAAVGHGNLYDIAPSNGQDRNRSTGRRMAKGIDQQIAQDLGNPVGIGLDIG